MDAAFVRRMKGFSLVSLCVQNAALTLLTRYVRTRSGAMFHSSVAVLMSEVCKIIGAFFLMLFDEGSLSMVAYRLRVQIWEHKVDTLKVCGPGMLYTIQNNLLYVAASNLNVGVYQVTYQMKIITTAVFMLLILGKPISRMQWSSLVMLVFGVILVQLSQELMAAAVSGPEQDYVKGMVSALLAVVLSGLAGVMFEKVLKGTDEVTVWVRNIQMAVLSVPMALAGVYLTDAASVAQNGFFYGFDGLVWLTVILNAAGGLLVALTVKYADNILKGFSTSIAIVLSFTFGSIIGDVKMNPQLVLGAGVVSSATVMYSYGRPVPQKPKPATSESATFKV